MMSFGRRGPRPAEDRPEYGVDARTSRRVLALVIAFGLLFTGLIGRLFYIQIIDGERLQQLALSQWAKEFTIKAKRGRIMDRNGNVLAESASAVTVVVSPNDVVQNEAYENAKRLAAVLEQETEGIFSKMTDTSKSQVILKRQITLAKAEEVSALSIKGISLQEDTARSYPNGAFLTQVLGFCDISGQGQEGLEKTLDTLLSGTDGRVVTQVDAESRRMSDGSDEYIAAEDGYTVRLTIDYVLQAIVEKNCEKALTEQGAKSVQCVVMDPMTGEILAMTNQPDFDLNDPPRNDLTTLAKLMRNSCVTDAYEPGSTFKILTTSLALENGATSVEDTFTCKGYEMVDGDRIKCWRSGNPHGHQTLTEAVCNSCNPVFVQLALRMGIDTFYKGLDAFGIGRAVNTDLPGATGGQMIAIKYVKNVDIARVGFGQSVSVSPVQLLSAASAAINGGNLMKPHIVSQLEDAGGQTVSRVEPELLGNPISPETSATMRQILQTAVEEGGGRNAYIPGYRVGGKTGTAQKYVDGKVSSSVHICSFLGFAPMDDPQLAILFLVDEPTTRPDYGSTVAAPYARLILEEALQYLGVQPVYEDEEAGLVGKTATVPDVSGMTAKAAGEALTEAGLRSMTDGIGSKVVEQLPAAGAEVPQSSLVVLYTEKTEGDEETDRLIEVPDVTGLSMVQASRALEKCGLSMKIEGSGLAVRQEPEAGTLLNTGSHVSTVVRVEFEKPGG